MDYLKIGSSEIDWCESNYKISPYIAEFFNTASNLLFFIVPPITVHLFNDYAKHVTRYIHFIWISVIAVGAGSVYFHSTLSLAGQLMDELLILWVLMLSYTILFPEQLLPSYLRRNRHVFSTGFFIFTLVATYLCCLKPKLNAYFLMLFTIPIMLVSIYKISRCENKKVTSLGKRTVVIWIISVILWISDRVMCDMWLNLKFPYLHSIFHVTAFLSAHWSIVLFSYFTAFDRVPQYRPTIAYWPESNCNFLFSIPYINFVLPVKTTPSSNKLNDYVSVNLGNNIEEEEKAKPTYDQLINKFA